MRKVAGLPGSMQGVLAGVGTAGVLLLAYLHATSGPRELIVLTWLGLLALVPVSLLLLQRAHGTWSVLRAVRQEHRLFRAAAEQSPNAYAVCRPVCDSRGRILDFRISYLNRHAQRVLGHGSRLAMRQSVEQLLSSRAGESLIAIFARIAASGHGETVGIGIQGAAGKSYQTRIEPLGTYIALSIDLHDQKEAPPERTRELQEVAQFIIEKAPISMIATDASGMIVAVNAAAEMLTRYRKNDLIQQHSLLLLHDPEEISAQTIELNKVLAQPIKAGFETLIAKHASGEAEQCEWTYVRKDGSRVWVNLTMSPLQTPDRQVTGYLGIAFDVTERKQLTDSVVHMARHDQLTGLSNRAVLNDQLIEGIERAQRSGQKLAVFMVDVDHFKRVNDSLGHGAGDVVLQFVAQQLNSSLRSTDTVARVGGDEFVVLMPDFGSRADAERCADVMLQKICTPVPINDRAIRMTASIGFCLYPDDAATSSELLRKADVAMYEAKSEGRGCVRAYSAEMQAEAADKLAMEEELRYAVTAGEFALHYQPQVACATGRVSGMEMLLRWKSPKRGDVPPSVFIPVAEEAGLMIQIGEWGVAQACRDCMRAQRELGVSLRVAVNLSPRQFAQKNLTALVKRSLAETGLPASLFELEITEQMLMANTRSVMNTLREIRELGVSIAIDDFGTGFSSFAYILEYHVDRLKIDRSFVARVTQDENAAAVVRAMVAMGRGLNIELVAEGVETPEQLAFLRRRRCETVQGHLFAKAVPIEIFAETARQIEAESCPPPGKSAIEEPVPLRWPDHRERKHMAHSGAQLIPGAS